MAKFAKMFLCMVLACVSLGGASAQWMKGFTDSLASGSDTATMEQLIAEGGGIKTETCGGADDALAIEHISVQASALAVTVKGTLARELKGGTVRAKMNIDKPQNLSFVQHFKHLAATAFTRARVFSEPLCEHLGAAGGGKAGECAIPAGQQELRFSFKKLPEMLFVGKYTLELRAADEEGQPVACVRGEFNVQPGKSKGLLRKLEEGCPSMIKDNWWAFHGFEVSNDCEENNRYDLNFHMNDEADFYLQGHWMEFCTQGSHSLYLARRVHGLYKACDPDVADPCGHLPCSQKMCTREDSGRYTCQPTAEDGDCTSVQYYDMHPDSTHDLCHDPDSPTASGTGLGWRDATPIALAAPALLVVAFVFLQG